MIGTVVLFAISALNAFLGFACLTTGPWLAGGILWVSGFGFGIGMTCLAEVMRRRAT